MQSPQTGSSSGTGDKITLAPIREHPSSHYSGSSSSRRRGGGESFREERDAYAPSHGHGHGPGRGRREDRYERDLRERDVGFRERERELGGRESVREREGSAREREGRGMLSIGRILDD